MVISGNIKQFIYEQDKLNKEEKNELIILHNKASDDEMYGLRMFQMAEKFIQQGKLKYQDDFRILILSVDWPADI